MKPHNLCWPQQWACARIVAMYTAEECIFLVTSFIEMKSYVPVQRAFLAHFKCSYRKKPSRLVIQCLIQKFYTTGSVLDDKKGKVGAKRTVRMEEKEETRALVKENPALLSLVSRSSWAFRRRHIVSLKRHRVISWQGTRHTEIERVQKSETFAICRRLRCATCWKTKHAHWDMVYRQMPFLA